VLEYRPFYEAFAILSFLALGDEPLSVYAKLWYP